MADAAVLVLVWAGRGCWRRATAWWSPLARKASAGLLIHVHGHIHHKSVAAYCGFNPCDSIQCSTLFLTMCIGLRIRQWDKKTFIWLEKNFFKCTKKSLWDKGLTVLKQSRNVDQMQHYRNGALLQCCQWSARCTRGVAWIDWKLVLPTFLRLSSEIILLSLFLSLRHFSKKVLKVNFLEIWLLL